MKDYVIRTAQKSDVTALVELCKKHADFEQALYSDTNKSVLLEEKLFDSQLGIQCLVVVKDGNLVGYTTYMKQFSTWDVDFYVYLDCLYLEPEIRGLGIGKELMYKVKTYATAEKCIGVQWQTPNFNTKAITFYKKIGAKSKAKERFFW